MSPILHLTPLCPLLHHHRHTISISLFHSSLSVSSLSPRSLPRTLSYLSLVHLSLLLVSLCLAQVQVRNLLKKKTPHKSRKDQGLWPPKTVQLLSRSVFKFCLAISSSYLSLFRQVLSRYVFKFALVISSSLVVLSRLVPVLVSLSRSISPWFGFPFQVRIGWFRWSSHPNYCRSLPHIPWIRSPTLVALYAHSFGTTLLPPPRSFSTTLFITTPIFHHAP